jgi:hypothetical protein
MASLTMGRRSGRSALWEAGSVRAAL